jgi:hypothetical protein
VACSLCLALLPAFASAGAPTAVAASVEGKSFNELTEGQPETTHTTATTATTSTTTTASNSKSVILLALGAAVVVLCGIAFVIVRDARRVAPAGEDDLLEARSGHDAAVALRKRRAKAKAARRQRKRNR